jgi:hypothetical protein
MAAPLRTTAAQQPPGPFSVVVQLVIARTTPERDHGRAGSVFDHEGTKDTKENSKWFFFVLFVTSWLVIVVAAY